MTMTAKQRLETEIARLSTLSASSFVTGKIRGMEIALQWLEADEDGDKDIPRLKGAVENALKEVTL